MDTNRILFIVAGVVIVGLLIWNMAPPPAGLPTAAPDAKPPATAPAPAPTPSP